MISSEVKRLKRVIGREEIEKKRKMKRNTQEAEKWETVMKKSKKRKRTRGQKKKEMRLNGVERHVEKGELNEIAHFLPLFRAFL